MDRRSVLKSLLAAPVAVPVAAKAAAQRMGLSTVMEADSNLLDNVPIEGNSPFVDGAWAREQLKELMSDMNVRRRRQQAAQMGRILDADLAASRSISPSVAYHIQVERCYRRITEERRQSLVDEIAEATKNSMGLQ